MKRTGAFKIAGMLNWKLKKKAATKARKGVNPFTKEPCVFKAKPASKTVRVLAMKKQKQVKGVVEGIMGVASEQLKKNGAFKFAGMMNMKLKKKPATPGRKGVSPFTKEPCVFKTLANLAVPRHSFSPRSWT